MGPGSLKPSVSVPARVMDFGAPTTSTPLAANIPAPPLATPTNGSGQKTRRFLWQPSSPSACAKYRIYASSPPDLAGLWNQNPTLQQAKTSWRKTFDIPEDEEYLDEFM